MQWQGAMVRKSRLISLCAFCATAVPGQYAFCADKGLTLDAYLDDLSQCTALYSLVSQLAADSAGGGKSGQLDTYAGRALDGILLVAEELKLGETEIKARLARGIEVIGDEAGEGFKNLPAVVKKRAEYCALSIQDPAAKIVVLKAQHR
jgi:hypothetical protein